jgi:hypothetical protein
MLKEAIRRWLPERMIGAIQLAAHWAGRSAGERLTGMTSIGEQQFYTECANGLSHVDGVVVDLGCWMCSTAISLARGIRRQGGRPPHARRIYAIDRFIWDPWMDPWLSEVRGKYRPGDSFLPEALRRIGEYRDVIELVQADLTEYSWQHGPIKILLVDAMKSWQLARSITTSFYPSLVKGSVLIHQDFRDPHTPWIHILQYRLRDHFNLRHDVVDGWTTAFETVR